MNRRVVLRGLTLSLLLLLKSLLVPVSEPGISVAVVRDIDVEQGNFNTLFGQPRFEDGQIFKNDLASRAILRGQFGG